MYDKNNQEKWEWSQGFPKKIIYYLTPYPGNAFITN